MKGGIHPSCSQEEAWQRRCKSSLNNYAYREALPSVCRSGTLAGAELEQEQALHCRFGRCHQLPGTRKGLQASAEQGPGPGCSQVLGPAAAAWPHSVCVGPHRAWEAAASCGAPHGTHEVPSCHRAGPHP